jgi:hypothetical protein
LLRCADWLRARIDKTPSGRNNVPVSSIPISLEHAVELLAHGHAVYVDCLVCTDQHCYTSLDTLAEAIVHHGLKWKLSTRSFYVQKTT